MAIWLRRDELLARDWAGDAMTVTLAVLGQWSPRRQRQAAAGDEGAWYGG
jgi:hypothetical protein